MLVESAAAEPAVRVRRRAGAGFSGMWRALLGRPRHAAVAVGAAGRPGAPRTAEQHRRTPASTSPPPSSCSGASTSPNTANASATVTTGSAVQRIDAVVGPTRSQPGELKADRADGRDDREAAPASPSRRREPPGLQLADRGRAGGQRHRRAAADECRQRPRGGRAKRSPSPTRM